MMRRSTSSQSVKRVPQRTCVACRGVKAKRTLVRLVLSPDGSVEVDVGGKKVGRGAYLCLVRECWEIGLKGDRLARSLGTVLTQENRQELSRFGADL